MHILSIYKETEEYTGCRTEAKQERKSQVWGKPSERHALGRRAEGDAARSASLHTDAESNLRDRTLGEVEKGSVITLSGKGGHGGLQPRNTVCPRSERIVQWEGLQSGFREAVISSCTFFWWAGAEVSAGQHRQPAGPAGLRSAWGWAARHWLLGNSAHLEGVSVSAKQPGGAPVCPLMRNLGPAPRLHCGFSWLFLSGIASLLTWICLVELGEGRGGWLRPFPIIWGLEYTAGEGNGTPLQSSCLENPTDEGAW